MIEDGYPIFNEKDWKAVPGAQAGALILDRPLGTRGGKRYWACHCLACGNSYVEKREYNLKIGAIGGIVYATGRRYNGTRSCGCKQNKQFVNANTTGIIEEDLTGQILNGWKLIEKTTMKDNNRSWLYICQSTIKPECFDLISIRHLKDGRLPQARYANKKYEELQLTYTQPKAHLSGPEEKMLSMLKESGLTGQGQVRYENCKDKLPLPFDFVINAKIPYIIEVDGQQHFKPAWGGEEGFLMIRAHDLIKNKFCFDNNIPLIRIPDNVEYTKEDLIPETTRFLLTPENEKEYYENRT
jgi:hypothetical protein